LACTNERKSPCAGGLACGGAEACGKLLLVGERLVLQAPASRVERQAGQRQRLERLEVGRELDPEPASGLDQQGPGADERALGRLAAADDGQRRAGDA